MSKSSMKERILMGALDAIPDPPCLKCTWKAYCTENATACRNFLAYVNEGYRHIPGGKNEPWPADGPKPKFKIGRHKSV